MAKSKITSVEEALKAVKNYWQTIINLPENLKTPEVCLEAVRQYGQTLEYVPEKLKTEELCLKAVKQHGFALEYVPEKLKTVELCLKAVKQNYFAVEYVPKKPEMVGVYFEAVKQHVDALKDVPWEQLDLTVPATAEMCLAAVKRSGFLLEYVPEKLKTVELCLAAVKQDGRSLEFVPEKLKTAELCLKAVKDGGSLEFVPWGQLNLTVPEKAKLCLIAVKENGMALKHVPWGQLNLTVPEKAKLCLEAVKNNPPGKWYGSVLEYVPENLRTAELCFEAVKKGGGALKFVPENLKTAELCFEAVKHDSQLAVHYVPKNLKTIELCLVAVRGYTGWTASYRSAVGDPFSVVPKEMEEEVRRRREELMTPELCLEAVKRDGRVLEYVPFMLTVEFCLEAVRQNSSALEHVPEDLREEVRHRANLAVVNIKALTQEGICFEFDILKEKGSDFITDKINIFVTIPNHREVPKSITVKLTNIGKTAEQKETVINYNERFPKGELEGIVILQASVGKPRPGYKYRQKAEITLNFENRYETLICPINRTTTFSMCFYDAYEAQKGKPDSVGDIHEFPE